MIAAAFNRLYMDMKISRLGPLPTQGKHMNFMALPLTGLGNAHHIPLQTAIWKVLVQYEGKFQALDPICFARACQTRAGDRVSKHGGLIRPGDCRAHNLFIQGAHS